LGIAVDPSVTMTRTGYTAGAGLEWAFAPHWSATLEYDFYDFGENAFAVVDLAWATRQLDLVMRDVFDPISSGCRCRGLPTYFYESLF
jgi:hypothetical protein